jgi:glycosyltransferase involved in cell wall biosynthesis
MSTTLPSTTVAPSYEDVDVAIVMESTYPYLKGGVSAVVHDIVKGNDDLTFGIIHISWDRESPAEDLYGMPSNVKWVKPVFLSMQEHREDFLSLLPRDLGMGRKARKRLATRLFDALESVVAGDVEPLWSLYDEGMNPRTRHYPIWAALGTKEFMKLCIERTAGLGMSLSETFWTMREFFSLSAALLDEDYPTAGVYHAHTTGYASLVSAAAARQNGTRFLLTEHNLYVRDTVNTLLGRNMALPVTATDYRTFDVTPVERAWMAWWTEMGRFCYPSAEAITFLYPSAISEAADLGAPIDKAVVIPNGMTVGEFENAYRLRQAQVEMIAAGDPDRVWRLAYIARVVPIKGMLDLIESIRLLGERGIHNVRLDALGPTEHLPEYYEACLAKVEEYGLQDKITFRGTVNVREMLSDFDLLVLPSYNEGQPIVVLEAMTVGIPTVGTAVGGMAELIGDVITTREGESWGAAGVLTEAGDVVQMADGIQSVISDPEAYGRYSRAARGRVVNFYQLGDVVAAYNSLYREFGGLPPRPDAATKVVRTGPVPSQDEELLRPTSDPQAAQHRVRAPWEQVGPLDDADEDAASYPSRIGDYRHVG